VVPEVLHVTDSTTVGGAEESMLTLIAGLDRARWRPILVHHGHPGFAPVASRARALGAGEWVVPAMPEGLGGARVATRFARLLRARRPAVVHAHMSWPLACKWPLLAARAAGVPAVLGTVQLFVEVPVGRLRRAQARLLGAATGRFLAVSADTRARLIALFGWPEDRVRVIHNAVDLDRFRGVARDEGFRASLGAADGSALALVPARLDVQKGHEHLLAAARDTTGVRFLLAGDGPVRGRLEARAAELGVEDRVAFLGRRDDVPALLAACDLVVLPSLYEGLPLSLIEAMAARRPIVATDIGGTRELVRDRLDGLLVPPGDPVALAAAIGRLRDDPGLAARLVDAGAARAAERFGAERMVRAVEAEYEELLGAR
jgi:glycosyltransferase involved in cell wall biosynthesis